MKYTNDGVTELQFVLILQTVQSCQRVYHCHLKHGKQIRGTVGAPFLKSLLLVIWKHVQMSENANFEVHYEAAFPPPHNKFSKFGFFSDINMMPVHYLPQRQKTVIKPNIFSPDSAHSNVTLNF